MVKSVDDSTYVVYLYTQEKLLSDDFFFFVDMQVYLEQTNNF